MLSYKREYIYLYMHIQVYRVFQHTHLYIMCTFTGQTWQATCVYTHIYIIIGQTWQAAYVCMYVCMYVCIYIYIITGQTWRATFVYTRIYIITGRTWQAAYVYTHI
jgi:hypothetical protein